MNNLWNLFNNDENYRKAFLVDVIEENGNYLVYADLPGFKKEEIKLSFNDGYLNIKASKNNEANEHHNYVLRERHNNIKKRSIYFGDIRYENIKAKYNDGVLEVIIITKKPEETKKHIIIE